MRLFINVKNVNTNTTLNVINNFIPQLCFRDILPEFNSLSTASSMFILDCNVCWRVLSLSPGNISWSCEIAAVLSFWHSIKRVKLNSMKVLKRWGWWIEQEGIVHQIMNVYECNGKNIVLKDQCSKTAFPCIAQIKAFITVFVLQYWTTVLW